MKKLLGLAFGMLLLWQVEGQTTYQQIARDTIVQIPGFLGKTYILDGKKLNLSVMEWFMSDYPEAHDRVRVAVVTDQLSIVSYTIGGLLCFAGVLAHGDNPSLGNDFFKAGGVGIAGGITLQIIAGSFQRKAVESYNSQVQELYKKQSVGYDLRIEDNGLTFSVRFD